MKKIAFYGKGGIGKSTTTSNVSAALAEQGFTVMQIGCDPKSDSTKNLTEGVRILTVLDAIKEKGGHVKLEDIVVRSDTGVLCVEAGGPPPGIGCAGRGIIAAFERLDELKAFQTYEPVPEQGLRSGARRYPERAKREGRARYGGGCLRGDGHFPGCFFASKSGGSAS